MINCIPLLVMCFHECHKKVGKGKVRIIIELDVFKVIEKEKSGVTQSAQCQA